LVGDDLLVTNPAIVTEAIARKAATSAPQPERGGYREDVVRRPGTVRSAGRAALIQGRSARPAHARSGLPTLQHGTPPDQNLG